MKTLTSENVPRGASLSTQRIRVVLARAWHSARHIASETLIALQISRMASVMSQMSDDQLAQIGIARHEVYTYAENLVLNELVD
jgi:uncharacterized protein YjiS (DUF1127 family)